MIAVSSRFSLVKLAVEAPSLLECSGVVPSSALSVSTWIPFSTLCTNRTSVLLIFRSILLTDPSVRSKDNLRLTVRRLSNDRILTSFRCSFPPTCIPLSTLTRDTAAGTLFSCVTLLRLTVKSSSFKFSTFCSSTGWRLGVKFSSTLCGRSLTLPSGCAIPSRSLDDNSFFAVSNSSFKFAVSFWASFNCASVNEILFSFSVSSFSIFSFSKLLLSKRFSRLERLVRDSISSSESMSFSSSMAAIFCFIDKISLSMGDISPVESSLLLSILLMALSRSNFSTCDALRAKLILSTFASPVENFLIDLSFSSSSLFEIWANRNSSDKSLSSASRVLSCVPTLSSNRFDSSTCEDWIFSKPLIWCFASCINLDICELSSFSRPRRDLKPSVSILSVAVVSFSTGRLLVSWTLFCLLSKAFSTSFRRLSFSSSDNKYVVFLIFLGEISPYFLNCKSSSLSSCIRSSSACFCIWNFFDVTLCAKISFCNCWRKYRSLVLLSTLVCRRWAYFRTASDRWTRSSPTLVSWIRSLLLNSCSSLWSFLFDSVIIVTCLSRILFSVCNAVVFDRSFLISSLILSFSFRLSTSSWSSKFISWRRFPMVVSFASDNLFSFNRLSFSFLMVSRASLKSLTELAVDVVWTNDILTWTPGSELTVQCKESFGLLSISCESLSLLNFHLLFLFSCSPEHSSALSLVSLWSLLSNRILNCFPSFEKLGIVLIATELPLKSRFSPAWLQDRDSSERDFRIACPCDKDSSWIVRWWDMSVKQNNL